MSKVRPSPACFLANLDHPTSLYLDADAFKDLQVGTQGELRPASGSNAVKDGLVKVVKMIPIEDTLVYRAWTQGRRPDLDAFDDTPVKGRTPNDAVKKCGKAQDLDQAFDHPGKGETKPIEVTLIPRGDQGPERQVQAGRSNRGSVQVRITQFHSSPTWSSIWAT